MLEQRVSEVRALENNLLERFDQEKNVRDSLSDISRHGETWKGSFLAWLRREQPR